MIITKFHINIITGIHYFKTKLKVHLSKRKLRLTLNNQFQTGNSMHNSNIYILTLQRIFYTIFSYSKNK